MKPEIIAELSCNHLGSIDRARPYSGNFTPVRDGGGHDSMKPRARWCDRTLLRSQYVGLCTSEAQFQRELRRFEG